MTGRLTFWRRIAATLALLALVTQIAVAALHSHSSAPRAGIAAAASLNHAGSAPSAPDQRAVDCDLCFTLVHLAGGPADESLSPALPLADPARGALDDLPRPASSPAGYRSRAPPSAPSVA